MEPVEEYTKIESVFVRGRNALLLRGAFTPVFTDYYLHLMQHGIRHGADLDQMLKDCLAVLSLHCTARPWAETIAWTANLRAPRVNLFVTGSSTDQSIVGRIFTEDVREPDRNLLYAQTISKNSAEPRNTMLEVEGRNPLQWMKRFYEQSEQRPCQVFSFGDDRYALIAAQPDCDLDWLAALDAHAVENIEATEQTNLLETRRFRFHCGCTLDRILPVLGGWRERMDELFGDQDSINVQCPRCAANFTVTRGMLG